MMNRAVSRYSLAVAGLLAPAAVAVSQRIAPQPPPCVIGKGSPTVSLVTPPSSEVAVLPFVHESDGEVSMFLSMGIPSAVAERIVEAIPDLPVLRPRPNRPTTDDAKAMKDMGSQLGARFIVSGTVFESRRSVRLSV